MITYILTVMSLHCSLALPTTRGTTDTGTRYDCAPQTAYLEFTDMTEDAAFQACQTHKVETIRLMGKYAYKATLSCKRKGGKK